MGKPHSRPLPPAFAKRYAQQLSAKRASLPPFPAPSSTPEPSPDAPALAPLPFFPVETPESTHPFEDRWAIQAFKLSPGKGKYFATVKGGYFLVVKECGTPLKPTRHILYLYKISTHARTVGDILASPVLQQAFTFTAFMFHDKQAALQSVTETLPSLI